MGVKRGVHAARFSTGEEAELFFSYSLDSSSWRSSPIGIRRAPVDRFDVFRNKARNFRSRTICARKEPIPFSFFLSFLSVTFSSSSFAVRPQAALRGGLETLVVIDEGEAEGGGGEGKKLKEEMMKKKKKKEEEEERS